jgi:Ni/Co efflux regulator RcnB
MKMLNVPTPSLASQLPQFLRCTYCFCNTKKPCGSWLASDGGLTDNYNPQPAHGKNKECFPNPAVRVQVAHTTGGSPMNSKTLIASLALVAGIAGISPLVQAAQTSNEQAVQSPVSDRELKVNDRAPDIYQRSEKAITNWKQKGLKQPEPQAQWVQINDQYVMVMITNGTIVEMKPVER